VVYGHNHLEGRKTLWLDLIRVSQKIDKAWCVMGDFNSTLYARNRMEGIAILDSEMKDFTYYLEVTKLTEMIYICLLLMG